VIAAGCDLLYYGGDVTELCAVWPKLLGRVPASAQPAKAVQK
jgi:hypothetical protein